MLLHQYIKNISRLLIFIVLALLIFLLGRNLNPFSDKMFNFHDMTQLARISEFTYNIKNLQIPPRMAPHFSFNFGYPVFNFYAPFSYWITSLINLLGFDVIASLKLSFLLALSLSFIFMFKFLRLFFSFISSVLGAVLYVTVPYFAVEIFVRGNLAETWFISLMPLVLYLLYKNSRSNSVVLFISSSVAISFVLTVHNALSPLFLITIFIYILLAGKIKKNIFTLVTGLLISSYFLIPFLAELPLTYAKEIAKQTIFSDHFLCWSQLWFSPWGYGGSVPGCINDGMSFMLGKIQIILASAGLLIFLHNLVILKKRISNFKIIIFVLILGLGSVFLTTYSSSFVWEWFSPYISVIQFPWRFLVFAMFGIAFFAAYGLRSKTLFSGLLALIFIFGAIFINSKYFTGIDSNKAAVKIKYLGNSYITDMAAYSIPEYLPRTANYSEWRKFYLSKDVASTKYFIQPNDNKSVEITKDNGFIKEAKTNSGDIRLNIHYFPYWKILINDTPYIPRKFDLLGRPFIKMNSGQKTILVKYEQTQTEKLGDSLSLVGILFLFIPLFSRKLWKKLN